jgi:hypothetical protein
VEGTIEMAESHGKAPWSSRALAVISAAALVLSGATLPSPAAAELPATPDLSLERTLRTRPFLGSTVGTTDHEGSAYVPQDNSLWLADDDGHSIYEVNALTGALKRRIRGYRFAEVRKLGGSVRAGKYRTAEIQALAYDPSRDELYAFSGTCCPPNINSTAFRLTRQGGELRLDSYRPLDGLQVEAAAWNPGDGRLYLGSDTKLWGYSYATNFVGSSFGVPGLTNIYGMDFTDDGRDLFVARPYTRVSRVDWSSKTLVPGWDLDLLPFGMLDVRAVEVVHEQLWISDGSDLRAAGDPLNHALFVLDVGGTVNVGENLIGNTGFERDLRGWDTRPTTGVSVQRERGGHTGSWSARVKRTQGTGSLRLADDPGWVPKSRSGTYTAGLWVRSAKPGEDLVLRIQERVGKRTVGLAVARVALKGKWQHVSVTLVPRSAGRSSIDYVAFVPQARPGASFDADSAHLGHTAKPG